MARKLRLQYSGAIYHVMNRGDRREAIFLDDVDRQCFLDTLSEACQKTDWQVQAYCLMGNHFHLVVETPQPNLVGGMKWLLQTDTCRFNHRHRYGGHLFSGRYKAPLVDGSGNGYLRTVCEYVHLNPVRAHLLRAEEPLSAYRWSSYPARLKPGTTAKASGLQRGQAPCGAAFTTTDYPEPELDSAATGNGQLEVFVQFAGRKTNRFQAIQLESVNVRRHGCLA